MLAKLEGYWNSLRLQRVDIPAAHLLINAGSNKQSDLPTKSPADGWINPYLDASHNGITMPSRASNSWDV